MSAAQRRDALLGWLRGVGPTTIEHAAERFEVSERTIHRDLDHLRERGLTINADRGRGGGIYLDPERSLPPVRLELEEVLALLVTFALSAEGSYLPLSGPARRALDKIVATLPKTRAQELGRLLSRVFVGGPASRRVAETVRPVGQKVLGDFETAFRQKRLLRFCYTKPSGEHTQRLVEPQGLLLQTPAWYLLAYDRKKSATRTFRMDRMSACVVQTECFLPRARRDFAEVLRDVKEARSLRKF